MTPQREPIIDDAVGYDETGHYCPAPGREIRPPRRGAPAPAGLQTHAAERCAGEACCIHQPSAHRMVDWPMHWRVDRRLMERVCPHGVGHPDPDHLAYIARTQGSNAAIADSIHGCDGCCTIAP